MNREYHRWHSPRLGRDMELLIFGHAGAKALMFPTREGRFWEYEQLGVVTSLADKIEAGHIQLYCVEGLAQETFYDRSRSPEEKLRRYQAFEDYLLNEVMHLMADRNGHDCTMAVGCSLGAFQAASLAFRHPQYFRKLVLLSGRYDLTLKVESFGDLFEGFFDDGVYYLNPSHFLPGLQCEWRLECLRRMDIILAIGRDDPFFDNNRHLSRVLREKGVGHQMQIWDGRAHRGSAWRRMAPLYV
jgi:esterase/lipase superfamily enzyme